MAINEIFPNPTVKEVIFQIKYPNLFFIEKSIGDYQLKIMKEYENSKLIHQQPLFFTDTIDKKKIDETFDNSAQSGKRIWQFTSNKGVQVNVTSHSLDISSKTHETYNNPSSDNRFRDTINFAVKNFIETINIPIITRIGLRYIDECPILKKNNKWYKRFYNTRFPLNKYNLENSKEMAFHVNIKKDEYYLTFNEYIHPKKDNIGEYVTILDFDAYKENIDPESFLNITDNLYDLIIDEYQLIAKKPLYDYMRKK